MEEPVQNHAVRVRLAPKVEARCIQGGGHFEFDFCASAGSPVANTSTPHATRLLGDAGTKTEGQRGQNVALPGVACTGLAQVELEHVRQRAWNRARDRFGLRYVGDGRPVSKMVCEKARDQELTPPVLDVCGSSSRSEKSYGDANPASAGTADRCSVRVSAITVAMTCLVARSSAVR